jgi:hypothetical protein
MGISYRPRLSPLMKGSRMQLVSISQRLSGRWVVKDERSVNTSNAFAYCLDMSG